MNRTGRFFARAINDVARVHPDSLAFRRGVDTAFVLDLAPDRELLVTAIKTRYRRGTAWFRVQTQRPPRSPRARHIHVR
ncbi:hypothetical protein [Cryptosporangium sp. NPDC051539]|uniref:hypothetical protein n=1 Tax=Cryptosporangium sp. NPDC051539 TaxID=3363962 RepID=UPI0037B1D0B5